MSFFLVFLAVLLVAAVLWAGLGRRSRGTGGAGLPSLLGGGLEDPPANLPPVLLPAHAGPEDVNQLRFSLGLRGYRMDQVDQVLEELRDQLAARDQEVAELRDRLAAMEQDVPEQDSDDGPAAPADPVRIDPGSTADAAAEAHGDRRAGDRRPVSTVARRSPLASAGDAVRQAASAVRGWPWWIQTTVLYAATRVVSACIFMAAALHQGVNPWFPPKPDYWNFINIWDARWYAQVIANGYPSVLPTDAAGNVQENTWAFYPLFPALAGGLSRLTGLNPAASLTLVAMLAGWGAALLAYVLFRQKAAHGQAMWGVAFFATFPVSAVLQVPYAESLSLLLLAWALLLLLRRQYLWAMPGGVPAVPVPACGRSLRRHGGPAAGRPGRRLRPGRAPARYRPGYG